MTTHDLAVDGNPAPRANQHDFTWSNTLSLDFHEVPIPKHTCRLWQEVEHVLNRAPATTDRQPFENLGRKDERRDDQGGEELTDCQSSNKRNGHRELHRHPALDDVLERFFEDRIPTNQRGGEPNDADSMKRLPQMEPHCGGGEMQRRGHVQRPATQSQCSWSCCIVINFRCVVSNVRMRSQMLVRGRLIRMFCNGAHVRLLRGISGHGNTDHLK